MKKLLVTFLGIAFLLPALASAGSYCVTLPDGGNSKWSGRDNNVGIQFRYDYYISNDQARTLSNEPEFFTSTGTTDGPMGTNHIVEDYYTYYPLKPYELCVYDSAPDFGRVTFTFYSEGATTRKVDINELQADIKYGRDCPTVAIKNNRIVGGDHKFEIYRRSGDHINPWGCKKK